MELDYRKYLEDLPLNEASGKNKLAMTLMKLNAPLDKIEEVLDAKITTGNMKFYDLMDKLSKFRKDVNKLKSTDING